MGLNRKMADSKGRSQSTAMGWPDLASALIFSQTCCPKEQKKKSIFLVKLKIICVEHMSSGILIQLKSMCS